MMALAMSPRELAPLVRLAPDALAAQLESIGDNEARQTWIDEAFAIAEDSDPSNAAGLFDLAWRANDVAVLLNRGANPAELRHSIYRGIVSDFGPDDEPPPPIPKDRPPANIGTIDDPAPELEGIDAGMASLRELAAEQPPARFQLLTPDELRALPPMRWRVRGILPADGIAACYGASGSGKTFLLLDLLGAIADGRPWFDHATVAAPCVYVALEGEAGVAQRVRAYCEKHGTPERLRVLLSPLDLRDATDRAELASAIRDAGMAAGVVAIDTLNRSAPGIDENSAAEMGALIDAAKDLRDRLGGLVLLCHHTGKDAARGLRGHSSLLAALDAAIEVARDGDRRTWQLAKAKDAGDDEARAFRLEVAELGTDADGWPVSSCTVEPADSTEEAVRRSAAPGGGNQRIAWDAIGELLRASHTFGQGEAPPTRPCIRLADALGAIAPRLACEPKRQRERAQQAITGLINRPGCLAHFDGWLWTP